MMLALGPATLYYALISITLDGDRMEVHRFGGLRVDTYHTADVLAVRPCSWPFRDLLAIHLKHGRVIRFFRHARDSAQLADQLQRTT
jgi:hypothetical protein